MSDKPNNIPDNMMLISELFEYKFYFKNDGHRWQPVISLVTNLNTITPELAKYAQQIAAGIYGRQFDEAISITKRIYNSYFTTSILIKCN